MKNRHLLLLVLINTIVVTMIAVGGTYRAIAISGILLLILGILYTFYKPINESNKTYLPKFIIGLLVFVAICGLASMCTSKKKVKTESEDIIVVDSIQKVHIDSLLRSLPKKTEIMDSEI